MPNATTTVDVVAATAASTTASTSLLLVGIERADGASAGGGSVVTARWPAANGASRQYAFLTWRPAYSTAPSTGMAGVQIHEGSEDFTLVSETGGAGTVLESPTWDAYSSGPNMLVDTVPATIDQLDAPVSPGVSRAGVVCVWNTVYEVLV